MAANGRLRPSLLLPPRFREQRQSRAHEQKEARRTEVGNQPDDELRDRLVRHKRTVPEQNWFAATFTPRHLYLERGDERQVESSRTLGDYPLLAFCQFARQGFDGFLDRRHTLGSTGWEVRCSNAMPWHAMTWHDMP